MLTSFTALTASITGFPQHQPAVRRCVKTSINPTCAAHIDLLCSSLHFLSCCTPLRSTCRRHFFVCTYTMPNKGIHRLHKVVVVVIGVLIVEVLFPLDCHLRLLLHLRAHLFSLRHGWRRARNNVFRVKCKTLNFASS